MSTSMCKKIQSRDPSLSLKTGEETMLVQKQGIVTTLDSDCERDMAVATSLQRTLSADMSSQKWLSQNGLSPMKKIASSEELSLSKATTADSLSLSEGEDDHLEEMKELEAEAEKERLQIWSLILQDKKQHQKPAEFDTWNSILSHKTNKEPSNSLLGTPYIHPLVNGSKSSLSENSLKICTESLGSETGFDGFSSYPPSETRDSEEDKEEGQEQQQPEEVTVQAQEEELTELKYNNQAAKKSQSLCFPPPLPSLSRYTGPSLHMRSHRDNGRLFLEAVSLPSQNNFCAQRHDGRLVLTFAGHLDGEESKEDDTEMAEEEVIDHVWELEQEFVGFEEDGEDDEAEEDKIGEVETVMEQAPMLSSGITSLHRMMNKPIGIVNRKPTWSEKFNKVNSFEDVNIVHHSLVANSLPPRPRVVRLTSVAAAAASFNAYEYYWRIKPMAKAAHVPNPLIHEQDNYSSLENINCNLIVSRNIDQTSNDRQQLLVFRGKNGDYLVHSSKSCKDFRFFLFWEPYCVAT